MATVPILFREEMDDGRLKAFIFLSETLIQEAIIKRVYQEIFCTIPAHDKMDCSWSEVRRGAWKFTVFMQPHDDAAARFRKDTYLWRVLVRISPKNIPDFASFMLH